MGWFTANPRKLEHGFRGFMLGFPILYFKGMRLMMFQLSGFYYRVFVGVEGLGQVGAGIEFRVWEPYPRPKDPYLPSPFCRVKTDTSKNQHTNPKL